MNTRQIERRLTFDDRISPEVARAVMLKYPEATPTVIELLKRQDNWDEDTATPTFHLKTAINAIERERHESIDDTSEAHRQQKKTNEARKTALGYGSFIFCVSLALTTPMIGLGSIPLGIVAGIIMYNLMYNLETKQ